MGEGAPGCDSATIQFHSNTRSPQRRLGPNPAMLFARSIGLDPSLRWDDDFGMAGLQTARPVYAPLLFIASCWTAGRAADSGAAITAPTSMGA